MVYIKYECEMVYLILISTIMSHTCTEIMNIQDVITLKCHLKETYERIIARYVISSVMNDLYNKSELSS